MSFERWNKFVKEQLSNKKPIKADNTPPPKIKSQEGLSIEPNTQTKIHS